MAQLPYNPTVLLTSPTNDEVLYILDGGANDASDVRLRGLNISSNLSAEKLEFKNVDESVPFGGEAGTSYSAFMSTNGTMYAFAGKCGDGATGASAWSFAPEGDPMTGSWRQAYVSVVESGDPSIGGANYLAAGVAFSSNPNATADLYIFGGMCPHSTDGSSDSWQSSADYSNILLQLERTDATDSSEYLLETVGGRGPPIPEAGFSVTPLSPTYFNHSSGNVTMQQNFVLLGGHTQSAFINMSQVAVLSLPEKTWAFIPVTQPDGSTSVDPRSGHTAVLSEDGSKIILLGGWVGDTSTPADPQLAILEIGEGYGGDGTWQWTIPSATGPSPKHIGIYGHGATLLPGNVLMISGGYQIGSSQGELARRAQLSEAYFFNVTTRAWVTDYTNPNLGENSNTGQGGGPNKAGLGAGIALGLLVVIASILAFFWFRRKKRREQKIEEKDLQALALGNERFSARALGFGGIDGRGGDLNAGPYLGGSDRDEYPWAPTVRDTELPGQTRRSDAERTGLLVEIPSPTRGLRRSLHSRGSHWYEDGRRSRGSGYIHPIDERDEFEQVRAATHSQDAEMAELDGAAIMARPPSRALSDPFRDPPMQERSLLDGSRTPSPVRDIDLVKTEITGAGVSHLLPEKDKSERTLSTLSERSMVSALSQQQSVSNDSFVRTQSQRSTNIFSTRPLGISTNGSSLTDRLTTNLVGARESPPGSTVNPPLIPRRPVPLGSHPPPRISAALQPGATTGASPSSFRQLQAEGPNLLMGVSSNHDDNNFDPEPIPRRKQQSRPRSWMGSMRRALVGSTSIASHSSGSTSPGVSPRRQEFFTAAETSPVYGNGNQEVSNSARHSATTEEPKAPWGRHQKGSHAWVNDKRNPFEDDTGPIGDWGQGAPPTASQHKEHGPGRSDGALADDEGEWDVEGAVERRQVQIMFTVPRDKLRVVNGAPDGDERSVRSNHSVRSLRRSSQEIVSVAEAPDALFTKRPTTIHTTTLNYEAICKANEETKTAPIIHAAPAAAVPLSGDEVGAESDAESDANFVVHSATDDEADEADDDNDHDDERPDATPRASHIERPFDQEVLDNGDDDDDDANFVVHAPTDDEGDDGRAALGVKALAWRQRRDAAAERLRQVSGEEAVRRVSGERGGDTAY